MVCVQKKVFFSIIPRVCYVVFACLSLWKLLQQLFYPCILLTYVIGGLCPVDSVCRHSDASKRLNEQFSGCGFNNLCVFYGKLIQLRRRAQSCICDHISREWHFIYECDKWQRVYAKFWCRRQSIRFALELFAKPSSN